MHTVTRLGTLHRGNGRGAFPGDDIRNSRGRR